MKTIITGLLRLENDNNKLFLIKETIIHLIKRDLKGLTSLIKFIIIKEII
jgi:hypothetical protein